jgi:O-antigen ligase
MFAVGIVCSKALLSIGILLGLLNLLLEMEKKVLFQALKSNLFFGLIAGLFILHLLGLIWTENYAAGWDDVRMKTSLLTIPLIVVAKPNLVLAWRNRLLNILLLTILLVALINTLTYFQLFGSKYYSDMRELSLFGSHIRFGILVAFGVAIALYQGNKSGKWNYFYWVATIVLIAYTVFSQVFSGLVSLLIVLLLNAVFVLSKKRFRFIGIGLVLSIVFAGCALLYYLSIPPKESNLPVNKAELEIAWKQHSKYDFQGVDRKKQPIFYTIVRYLHSKDLPANREGMNQLEASDFREMESGTADVNEKKPGFLGRLNEMRYQIHVANNPNGSTLLQRLEFWKAGLQIIQSNFLIGVGTGDIKSSFQQEYQVEKSVLLPENRLEAHNTYLTFFITFGVGGFLYLIFVIFKFTMLQIKARNKLALIFIGLIAVSFLTEDTLETQMGISIFSYLFALFSIQKTKSIDE